VKCVEKERNVCVKVDVVMCRRRAQMVSGWVGERDGVGKRSRKTSGESEE
jgi:hypothetical protein